MGCVNALSRLPISFLLYRLPKVLVFATFRAILSSNFIAAGTTPLKTIILSNTRITVRGIFHMG